MTSLPGSEHMIAEFNKRFAEEYKIKTAAALEAVIEKRNAANKNNAKTVRDRNTAADIAEAGADEDDDDEQGNSEEGVSENATEDEDEDEEGEGGKGTGSQFKCRQARSFYFTTGAVNRIESKQDSTLTAICQVGHAECSKSIPMPNGGTQGVLQHFLKFHPALVSRSGL